MTGRILTFLILNFLFTSIQAQNGWAMKAGSPIRRNRATAFTIGNYGYIGTGAGDSRLLNDFWRYDPKTDAWTEIDTMPTLGRRGAFSFAINNMGYVGGGVNQDAQTDYEFWEYNAALSQWSRKENLPHVLVFSEETLIGFSIGQEGYLLAPFSRSNFYSYSPTSDTWSLRAQFPGSKTIGGVGFVIGGKGYVGTGYGGTIKDIREFWEYDPIIDQWSKMADVPDKPRADAVGFSIGDYGYIGLGTNFGDFQFDFWEYHPLSNSWIQIDDCPYAVWYAVGIGIGSKGYLGTGEWFSQDTGWWEYSPNVSFVNDIGQSERINVSPNPTSDKLYFDSNRIQGKSFSIYSVSGQLMQTGLVSHNAISVAELPEGVYFLKLLSRDQPITLKFIKE